jgi:hypothetical protein
MSRRITQIGKLPGPGNALLKDRRQRPMPGFEGLEEIFPGIRLRRDNLGSVRYAERLNSAKSSVTFQRTDRHGIVGQKPPDFQLSL